MTKSRPVRMNPYFDEKKWDMLVTTRPDWYLEIYPELKALNAQRNKASKEESQVIRDEIYNFFERRLRTNSIILEEQGDNSDKEREEISEIVVHHTSRLPGMPLSLLNAIHFTRLYIPQFAQPRYEQDKLIRGKPIWSGHFKDGKQIFYAYHWLVRMDGSTERLLKDEEIGWQAGNWDVNKRSVAICFDNDYTDTEPATEVLKAAAKIIKENYPAVRRENVIGHREVNVKTECPGNTFLEGWKVLLTRML